MFSPVQVKHECTTVEDVNSTSNTSIQDNSVYPIFINRDVEHVSHHHLWVETQLSNEIPVKTEIYNQEAMFQTQEHESLPYMKDYVQNDIFYAINQEHSDNQMQTNNLCHQNTNSTVVIQENKQTPLLQDLQNIGSINQTLPPKSSISAKSNSLERLSKNTDDSNMGKKLKYKCEICLKEFGHKSNLFIHMRTHNGERPYKCNQCDKCFTHSGNLAIHMRTHSGERPYACQICGKMFSHSGNLSTHLRTHSGVKPYKCSVCNKEFRHSGNLSIHERIHSGVKPFHCKVCGKEFYHSGNLTTHMKKHPVNTNDCKSEQRDVRGYANEDVNTSSSDVSLNDIKSRRNNVVPTKQESTEDMLLDSVGILTPS